MNTHQLETFVRTADAGSFLKASERLFISPNAITKQIDTMERELGLSLFLRSHSGLRLTAAGDSFYQDAKRLLQAYQASIARAKNAEQAQQDTIRIGTSAMTPSKILLEVWPKIHALCPALKIQLVPFENKPETASNILENLGTGIDLVMGILEDNDQLRAEWPCQCVTLLTEPLCVGLSVTHPLAQKEELTMDDLCGEKLLLLERGGFSAMDQLRDDILHHHPQIAIEDFDFYDIDIFNRCETTHDLLLTVKSWDGVHPLIKVLPVAWKYKVPFGILYGNAPSEQVLSFIRAAAQVYSAGLIF